MLVVFALDDEVRRWAAQPIPLGHPGFQLAPLVVGPSDIPRITDPGQAREAPCRAILSALVHADEPGAEHLVLAAYDGIATLEATESTGDIDWRVLLLDALASNEVARRALTLTIDVEAAKARSPWVWEAREEGRNEGRAEVHRSSIERLLATRGITFSADERSLLDGCSDLASRPRCAEGFDGVQRAHRHPASPPAALAPQPYLRDAKHHRQDPLQRPRTRPGRLRDHDERQRHHRALTTRAQPTTVHEALQIDHPRLEAATCLQLDENRRFDDGDVRVEQRHADLGVDDEVGALVAA